MELPSTTLTKAVEALSSLPGVGKRTALRFALHLVSNLRHVTDIVGLGNEIQGFAPKNRVSWFA